MSSGSQNRPHLSLEELQQLKWLLGGLLTLIGVSTVFYMDVEAWTLLTITAAATIATMVWPTLPARVPPIFHTLAFPLIVAFFAADLWLKTEVLPAMVRLDMLLLLYRSIAYRQRRDDLQIIVLGLFLVIVAGVLTVSLTFAVQILVYTGCALALLLAVTLTDAAAGVMLRTPIPFGETPGWAQHANWPQLFRRLRQVTDWRIMGLGIILFAGVVAVSALLFLAIPRFQFENGMFLDRFISKKAKTGFSDTVRFGDVTDIQQDSSVALSVDVSDQAQISASPYWRMLVLDHYQDGAFKLSPSLTVHEFGSERTANFLHGEVRPKRGAAVVWTFYLESGVSRYLPLLGPFEMLQFGESQNFRYAGRLAVVRLRDDPVTMVAYRVEGFETGVLLPDREFGQRWKTRPEVPLPGNPLQIRIGIQKETDLAALNQAVENVTGGQKLVASQFARAAGDWLKKNHSYSLSPAIPRGDSDPLVRWMNSRSAGHCELFAGSFVLMARAAGFPARMVVGFRGGTWNGYSNNFTIRNADAHAWAEIFDEEAGGWLRTDPLAPSAAAQTEEVRGEAAVASRLDRSWKARMDSLRVFWYRRIVSFDQRSQAETLKAVKEATENSGRRLRDALTATVGEIRGWLTSPWDSKRVVRVATILATIAVLVTGWRAFARIWWRRLMRAKGGRREDPVRREAGRWLRKGEVVSEGNGDHAEVTAALQRLRFGASSTWPDPEKTFRRARRALRDARRASRITRS